MKKLLALLLVFAMCFGILAACGQNNSEGTEPPATTTAPPAPAEDPDLASAVAYVKNIYKTVSEKTPQDFVRVGNVPMGEKNYEVVWSVDVAEDLIKIVKNEDGSVTIDVNEEADKDTPYVLTATLTGTDGRTETLSWNHLLPASLGGNMSAIVDAGYALADGEKLDGVYTLTGKIINVDTAWSSEYKNITVTIAVEGKEDKPIMCYRLTGDDLDAVKKLAYGDTITVSGTLKNYKGTIEFDQGCMLLEVVKGDGKGPEAPETYEEIVADAYALAEGKSLPYTATLTGKVIRIDYGYSAEYGDMSLTFECRGKQFYCYRLTGPEEWLKQVGEGDWITVKGKIKNYYGTVEFDAGCKMIAYTDWNKVEGPEDQLEHIDAALKLKENFDRLPYTTELTGVITGIDTPYSSSAKNITVTMQVAGREETPIQCYRLTGADLEAVKGLAKGDTITVTGTLMKYYEKIEFAEGCELLNVVKGEGGEEETLGNATLMTEAPKSGDIVLIWNSEAAMAATASGTKMGAVGAIPAEDGTVAITADMGQLTVTVDGEYYVFSIGGKYLASTGTGNNLGLQDAIDEYAKWTLASAGDNAWYITNAGANYNGNYNQTMEYYNGFTTYGKKETDIYKMKFYYVGEGTSVEIPDTPVVPEEPADTVLMNASKLTRTPVTGDVVVMYTSGNAMTDEASGKKLAGVAAELADGKLPVTDKMAQLEVTVDGEYFIFSLDGKYLVSTGTGSNLGFADTLDEYAKWTMKDVGNDTWYITNAGANYNGNYNQAIEYYNTFTTYGLKEQDAYKIALYVTKEGASSETPTGTSATLMTAEPENGDVIAIGFGETILTDRANGKKLTGAAATIAEGVATLTDEMAQLTVTKDGDYYIFSKDGKYLSTGLTGGNLTFASELTNCARWTLKAVDGGWYITNARAYNNQAMEYYSGFTTYGLNTDKTVEQNAAYVLQLYYVKDGTPVTIPAFAKPETAEDIVAAAYDLLAGTTLAEGPYTLTGGVVEIVGGNNVSITVEGKSIVCRALADGAAAVADVAVGDTVTVKGQLKNDAGTIVFDEGCTLEKVEKFVLDELPSKLTYNFSAVAQNSSTLSNDAALAAFLAAEANNNLMSVTVSTVYPGNGSGGAFANQGGFLKTGTGSKPGQLVLTYSDAAKVTKVEIKCYDWYKNNSTPNTVAANGSSAQNAPTNVDAEGNPVVEVLTFALDGSSNVVTIDATNRVFIFEIVVYFAD